MTLTDEVSATPRAAVFRLIAGTVAVFWVIHLVYRALIAVVAGTVQELFDPSLDLALLLGFIGSFGFLAILSIVTRRGLGFPLFAAALLSFPVSLLYSSVELFLFFQLSPRMSADPVIRILPDGTKVTSLASGKVTYERPGLAKVSVKLAPRRQMIAASMMRTLTENTSGWYFFYFGLGSFFVGMRNAVQLRQSEQRAATYERLARQAQLEALRYQINPHFLFNTLNALSALVMGGRSDDAERMILNLSRFYRSTLSIDPADDITLREELALQQLYLDIESVRFPGRLIVKTEIDAEMLEAAVPALILQPLIENAVKHGVARRVDAMTIRIAAGPLSGERLELVVENDQGTEDPVGQIGTGTGIRNVQRRLQARFGERAACSAGPVAPAKFRAVVWLPLAIT